MGRTKSAQTELGRLYKGPNIWVSSMSSKEGMILNRSQELMKSTGSWRLPSCDEHSPNAGIRYWAKACVNRILRQQDLASTGNILFATRTFITGFAIILCEINLLLPIPDTDMIQMLGHAPNSSTSYLYKVRKL